MIGCIVIAMKPAEQNPAEQKAITVEADDITPTPVTLQEVPETLITEEVAS
jgi:hypothetical protein